MKHGLVATAVNLQRLGQEFELVEVNRRIEFLFVLVCEQIELAQANVCFGCSRTRFSLWMVCYFIFALQNEKLYFLAADDCLPLGERKAVE